MNNWKHLNIEQRKLISHLLFKHYRLVEMADLLQVNPSSISKEIKRNRVLSKKGRISEQGCKRVLRFPYVCNGCAKKYNACPFTQFHYDPVKAQNMADFRLVHTRVGLNMTTEEYKLLDETIKSGVDNGESIYHIVKSNPELNISIPNVYRLINTHQLINKRMDLPYAVRYKKRKALKQYEYKENNRIDRTDRKYIDFLAFKHNHPHLFHVQMDFLGSVKTDKKSTCRFVCGDFYMHTSGYSYLIIYTIRRSIYTTIILEGMNKQIKRYTKRKEQFPNEASLDRFVCNQLMEYNQRFSSRVHLGFNLVHSEIDEMFENQY